MNTATSMTRNLQIDNMTGDVCVQKVTEALKGVSGVTNQSVKVGHAAITANQSACDAACIAIGAAGYPARELAPGEQCTASKTSRPGMVEGTKTDAAPAVEPKVGVAPGAASKIERDAKGGGASERIPMPAPVTTAAKTAVAAPAAPHRM